MVDQSPDIERHCVLCGGPLPCLTHSQGLPSSSAGTTVPLTRESILAAILKASACGIGDTGPDGKWRAIACNDESLKGDRHHYFEDCDCSKTADAILALTLNAAQGWQLVEMAPERSDKPMLLYFPPVVVGAYKQNTLPAMYRTGHPDEYPNRMPSHFMLLEAPALPSTNCGGGK